MFIFYKFFEFEEDVILCFILSDILMFIDYIRNKNYWDRISGRVVWLILFNYFNKKW